MDGGAPIQITAALVPMADRTNPAIRNIYYKAGVEVRLWSETKLRLPHQSLPRAQTSHCRAPRGSTVLRWQRFVWQVLRAPGLACVVGWLLTSFALRLLHAVAGQARRRLLPAGVRR